MTTPTEILCPDCRHDVLIHSAMFYHKHKGSVCACELDKRQSLAKWIDKDRSETRRAALLEAEKEKREILTKVYGLINVAKSAIALGSTDDVFGVLNKMTEYIMSIDFGESQKTLLVAQEQAQAEGGGNE